MIEIINLRISPVNAVVMVVGLHNRLLARRLAVEGVDIQKRKMANEPQADPLKIGIWGRIPLKCLHWVNDTSNELETHALAAFFRALSD
jgi:hypothetical protein